MLKGNCFLMSSLVQKMGIGSILWARPISRYSPRKYAEIKHMQRKGTVELKSLQSAVMDG